MIRLVALFFSYSFLIINAKQTSAVQLALLEPSQSMAFSHPEDLTLHLINVALKNDNLKRDGFKIMESYFDFDHIAQFILNDATEIFDREQQERFKSVFMDYQNMKITLKVKDLVHQDAELKNIISFPEKKIVIVSFDSKMNDTDFNLEFYTKKNEEGFVKIVDVHADSISILLPLQSEFNFLIEQNGCDEIISYFQKVLDEEKSDLQSL
ncbi:MAG: ABC transporter substrate-binding protein [Bdellovibrionaceae bacterium]|nr:ABC transporter substrate-binding protein [Pseudobdellovibrionaceae bacterium]